MSDVVFTKVAEVTDLPDYGGLRIEVDDYVLAIAQDDDGVLHAIDDACSHASVSLSEGEVEGHLIECWLHGAQFDLRTGHPCSLPATEPVQVYPVRVEGDDIFVGFAHK